jgi:type IX secretion system PorP/SprF family membrane protein
MRHFLSFMLFAFSVLLVFPQQDPQFSQNFFSKAMINPGSTGSKDMICATALNRQQWIGFDGAPVTSAFSINSPIRFLGRSHGIGLSILNDELGFEKNLSLNLAYAYRAFLGNGTLGIGVYGGLINSSLNATWSVPTSDYHTSPSTDPSVPGENESAITFDLGVGVYYYTEDFYVGVSSTHLNEPVINYTAGMNPFFTRFYYLTTGYSIPLKNPSYEFQPALFVQTDGKVTQMDVSGSLVINEKYWAGLSYRIGSAIIGMAGLELFSGIRVGYSYDFATSELRNYSKGSHEFVVNYCFSLSVDKTPKRYRSIRIL